MDFFSVASGSSGNCICLGSDQRHVMIDAGISGKRIEEGMNTYDYTTSDMDGVLITHEHSDHIQGLGVVARKYGLPIYATKGTADAILPVPSIYSFVMITSPMLSSFGISYMISSIYSSRIARSALAPVSFSMALAAIA